MGNNAWILRHSFHFSTYFSQGHHFNAAHVQSSLQLRKQLFSVQLISLWNFSPESVESTTTVMLVFLKQSQLIMFKNHYILCNLLKYVALHLLHHPAADWAITSRLDDHLVAHTPAGHGLPFLLCGTASGHGCWEASQGQPPGRSNDNTITTQHTWNNTTGGQWIANTKTVILGIINKNS